MPWRTVLKLLDLTSALHPQNCYGPQSAFILRGLYLTYILIYMLEIKTKQNLKYLFKRTLTLNIKIKYLHKYHFL